MLKIIGKQFDKEREFYDQHNFTLEKCEFKGPEDGESALKECSNVEIFNSLFDLRYPIWHCDNVLFKNSEMTPNCRAALWYSKNINIENSKLLGIKAVRECKDVKVTNSKVDSPEFGWKSSKLCFENCDIVSEYFLLEVEDSELKSTKFKGKYSFQYTKNITIENCELDTKDAFWHSENVIVKNSIVKGEYLGWYSKNLTLIDCTIIGTQPLCYCENLTLKNCRMIDTDLAFENSSVHAEIIGTVESVKNPLSGEIIADGYGEIIRDNNKYGQHGKITVREK